MDVFVKQGDVEELFVMQKHTVQLIGFFPEMLKGPIYPNELYKEYSKPPVMQPESRNMFLCTRLGILSPPIC